LLSSGEGAYLLNNDDNFAERCKLLRNHYTNIHDTTQSFTKIAWSYRITEIQAYISLSESMDEDDLEKILDTINAIID
jgi:dTDP-4-amino-4,6-dideoxygalactose transaminase